MELEFTHSKRAEFYVCYDGPTLASNEMDIRELAPALLAISKIVEEANNLLNEGKTKVTVNVNASFQKGSFGIELNVVQSFLSQINDFFNSSSVITGTQILAYLSFCGIDGKVLFNGLLQVLDKIKGRPIKNIETLTDGNIKLSFADDTVDITPQVMKLLENRIIRENLERAVKVPLEKEGFNSFAIRGENQIDSFVITKEQKDWYRCPLLGKEEELDEKTFTEKLQIVNLPFQDDNKWRFTDGNNTFFAVMEDLEFLRKINDDEIAFSKGDILEAQIHKKTWLDIEGKMKSEYRILQILSHRSAAKQLKLL